MNLDGDNVIGIVGGMGPQAGVALFNSILHHTRATTDQQHLSVMLMSLPKYITDRTAFLEGRSKVNPAFSIAEIIKKLEIAGAGVVGIACNTSYCPEIYNTITAELYKVNSQVKLVNMPQVTCSYIKKHYPQVRRVGLMTTNGTYRSQVYKRHLQDLGYEVLLPDNRFQNDVIHRMIYDPQFGIKANPRGVTGEVKLLVDKTLEFFRAGKADAIIVGCTDLSLIPTLHTEKDIIVVDAIEALALELIRQAMNCQTSIL